MGTVPLTGKNQDHCKPLAQRELCRLAAAFGSDLLGIAIPSKLFQSNLRTRPDVVAMSDDTEVARRWLRLCRRRVSPAAWSSRMFLLTRGAATHAGPALLPHRSVGPAR